MHRRGQRRCVWGVKCSAWQLDIAQRSKGGKRRPSLAGAAQLIAIDPARWAQTLAVLFAQHGHRNAQDDLLTQKRPQIDDLAVVMRIVQIIFVQIFVAAIGALDDRIRLGNVDAVNAVGKINHSGFQAALAGKQQATAQPAVAQHRRFDLAQSHIEL